MGTGFSGLLQRFVNCIISLSPLLQEKVRAVFDNLIQLEHLNIVKFHKYWADIKENKARVRIFSWYFLSLLQETSYIYCSFYAQRLKLGSFETTGIISCCGRE